MEFSVTNIKIAGTCSNDDTDYGSDYDDLKPPPPPLGIKPPNVREQFNEIFTIL